MAYTASSDVIIPSVFAAYTVKFTEVKNKLVESGAVARDSELDSLLRGGGKTFDRPKWNDLADTLATVGIAQDGSAITPEAITTHQETAVRLSRNHAWGAADLAGKLAGSDPLEVVAARRAARYWRQQLQLAVIATASGVFKDNDANDSGDYTFDGSNGGVYQPGVSTFSVEKVIDTLDTMGDSEEDLGTIWMHSKVYNRARKGNLIEFRPDTSNPDAQSIPFILGRRVIVDDGMPNTAGLYDTYFFGAGFFRWGVGSPRIPAESYRLPLNAAGSGTEALISRVEWCIHPDGHRYVGTAADGGPSNAATTNNLNIATSWDRVSPERKQCKIARLQTQES